MRIRFNKLFAGARKQLNAFLNRRPHRSFRLTRRRDYARSLKIPGYISFAHEVTVTVVRSWRLFLPLILIYTVAYAVLIGIVSQSTYVSLENTLKETGAQTAMGSWGALGQAGLLLASMISSENSSDTNEAQQVFAVLLFLLLWLTVIWLLRSKLAGHAVRLRDGLYNAGAPLVAMFMIFFLVVVQLLPIAAALLAYFSASASGLLESGVTAMLFWLGALLLAVLSLYWITSSLFAMVIVSVPGMYPYRAVRLAGDIVLGRRLRIMARWLYMAVVVALAWLVIMIPFILFESWLRSLWPFLESVPLIPVSIVLLTASSVVWVTTYVYLLYRKVVDDD